MGAKGTQLPLARVPGFRREKAANTVNAEPVGRFKQRDCAVRHQGLQLPLQCLLHILVTVLLSSSLDLSLSAYLMPCVSAQAAKTSVNALSCLPPLP